MNALEIRHMRGSKLDAAEAIRKKAEAENRLLTEAELTELRKTLAEAGTLLSQAEALESLDAARLQAALPTERRLAIIDPAEGRDREHATPPAQEWRDLKTGSPVYLLSNRQKVAELPSNRKPEFKRGELSFGRMLRALAVGSWEGAEAEQRLMSTSVNALGALMVPDLLSSLIIDGARAASVLVRAGAGTIPMPGADLTIARIESDPVVQVKAENEEFSETNPTLGAILLTARTIGCLIPASRELCEDAPNFAQMIEAQVIAALAAKLDYFGLQGTGAMEPLGIHNSPSVLEQAAVGALTTYEKIFDAIQAIAEENETPSAWILTPALRAKFDAFTIDAKANWFPAPPPSIAALQRFVSTQVPAGDIFVGDFTKMVLGVRTDASVEVSTTAGSAFARHQILLKLVFRGDWGYTRPRAIQRLTGAS